MLRITLPGEECFDNENEVFFTVGDVVLELEHSLVSLSKWESKFEKAFLAQKERTEEETLGYIEAMIVTPDYPENWYLRLTEPVVQEIQTYIESKMSGTWFSEAANGGKGSGETVTSELIYYWMSTCNIPLECENWHLNRLFNLIRIHSVKSAKPKKMSKAEQVAEQRRLNAERRAQMGTSG